MNIYSNGLKTNPKGSNVYSMEKNECNTLYYSEPEGFKCL